MRRSSPWAVMRLTKNSSKRSPGGTGKADVRMFAVEPGLEERKAVAAQPLQTHRRPHRFVRVDQHLLGASTIAWQTRIGLTQRRHARHAAEALVIDAIGDGDADID